MSLPRSKILSNVSKGFSAAADVGINSPEQTQIVNVNVNTSSPDLLKDKEDITSTVPISDPSNPYANIERSCEQAFSPKPLCGEPGCVNYSPEVKTRSIDTQPEVAIQRTSQTSLSDLQSLINSKDNIINAYSLMLDILENNPLLINKYVVADIDSLTLLISYLTEADKVDIQESLDVDCSCTGSHKYVAIDKIYITKNNETQNFKYQYPNANKILDDHHISVKFVVDGSSNL